ncbi:autolysin modifier protein [Listeria booriae]|uniref:immunoglobulin-like domain-containing protein n=1 Tax=Listeria booriae TaxID=1552123 RepID=UPI001629054E|nr:immunoglobulin-like domain-containing protein [Listeria booriae]MBC1284296.1 autolysin modifier protein [Listeria booriae]
MKKQTIRKIVTSALVANMVAGSVITALPQVSFAADSSDATTQSEKKLLSALQTTVPIIQNANFTMDPTTNTIPGWQFAVTGSGNIVSLSSAGSGWYYAGDGNFKVYPYGSGIQIYTTLNRLNIMHQTINTTPGTTYTFRYDARIVSNGAELLHTGARIYNADTNTLMVDDSGDTISPNTRTYSYTFVATGTKTRLEITTSCSAGYHGNYLTTDVKNVSATANNPTIPSKPVINAMTDRSTVISGTAKPYSMVSLYAGNSYLGDVRASASGSFSMTAGPYVAGTKISATATDSGNVSDKSEITVTATAIATPTINRLTDQSITASGTGEAGSALTLKIGDATYTTNVATNGTWSTTISKPKAGLVAEATSVKDGVTSAKASTTVVDVTAPDAPVLQTVTDKDTHVKGTGEAGTTVKVTLPNGTVLSGTVDTNGNFDIVIPAQAQDAVIHATLTDAAGNVSAAGSTTVVHAGPSAPVLNTVTDQSTRVNGTADAGTTVTVKITYNGVSISYTGLVDDFGEFSIPIDQSHAGATVDAIAKDRTNALSPRSSTVVQDVTAPDAPVVAPVFDTDTTIKGTGEANCDVRVTLPSGGVLTGRTNEAGAFSLTIPAQAAGRTLQVTLTDAAGNESTATTVTVQSSTLAAPTILPVTADDTSVKGTGVAGATVTLTIGNATYTGTVATDGTYTITIPAQPKDTVITAKQTLANRTSSSVNTTVTAGQSIAQTTIGALTTTSTAVTGTAEPNANIAIKVGTTTIASGVVGSDGKYSLLIQPQAAQTVVTATVSKEGLSSSASTTVTKQATGSIVVNAPYYVGYDANIKATVSGDVAKVYLLVNGTKQTTVPVSGTFNYYAKDKVTSTAQNVYLVALDTAGNELARAKVTLKDGNLLRGTVTTDTFIIGDSSFVTGSYTGAVIKVALSVNGVVSPSVAVGAANKLQYYAKDKITQTTDVVKIIGYNTEGTAIATANVSVAGADSLTGTITANPTNFAISTDTYVKGSYTGNVKTVALVVNGVESPKVGVLTGGQWQYYAKGKILNPTDIVTVRGYNAAGTLVDTKTITVSQNPAGQSTLTPVAYKLKSDSYVKGTFTGSVRYVALKVGAVTYSQVAVVDGTNWQYYAKDKIKNATDPVTILGYDSTGTKIVEATVSVTPETSSTLTASTYALGDGNVVGTYTGAVKYVAVTINGVSYGKVPVNADGTYSYYIKDKVTSKIDIIVVKGYDDANTVVAQANVTIDPGVAPAMTAEAFTIGTTRFVTGTYTGGVKYVGLKVGDRVYDRVPVATDGTYQYYAKDLITSATTTVTVLGYDAANQVTVQTVVTVR